jgi:hypothetical protein
MTWFDGHGYIGSLNISREKAFLNICGLYRWQKGSEAFFACIFVHPLALWLAKKAFYTQKAKSTFYFCIAMPQKALVKAFR